MNQATVILEERAPARAEIWGHVLRDGGPDMPPDDLRGQAVCYNPRVEINVDASGRNSMDPTRRANREDHEVTLQYQSRQETLDIGDLNQEKLRQLLAFIRQLEQTPPGAAELQRRTKLFGECQRIEGETSGQFHARLRHWLDRELPRTKSPLHAPRQIAE